MSAAPGAATLLDVRNLTVRFRTRDGVVQAVTDLSFTLRRGETLGEDYIRTARAKGLSERTVILKHGLRASLTPIVTIFGLDVALLIGGAIITESVFNIQGLGWLAFNSATTQDLPTLLGVVIVTATAVAVVNLIVDIIYAFLDPRVRYA